MNLPGLLVEYLINGCVAFIWLFSFEKIHAINSQAYSELLLIPVAYVLGMFIDFLAWVITRPAKKTIRDSALRVVEKEREESGEPIDVNEYKLFWDEKVEIEKSYPELNSELKRRSSRDRIARGTILNLIPITIVYWSGFGWIGILLLILSITMWIRFEHYNRCFEIRAAISVRNDSSKA